MVNYPEEIKHYSVTLSNTKAIIRLGGTKKQLIADIHFSTEESQDNPTKAFINRGGFISTTYPLSLLPSILVLLQQEDLLLIEENGDITNRIK